MEYWNNNRKEDMEAQLVAMSEKLLAAAADAEALRDRSAVLETQLSKPTAEVGTLRQRCAELELPLDP